MNEDAIFIMNAEHSLLRSKRTILLTTRLYCLFFVYVDFREEGGKDEIHLMPL